MKIFAAKNERIVAKVAAGTELVQARLRPSRVSGRGPA